MRAAAARCGERRIVFCDRRGRRSPLRRQRREPWSWRQPKARPTKSRLPAGGQGTRSCRSALLLGVGGRCRTTRSVWRLQRLRDASPPRPSLERTRQPRSPAAPNAIQDRPPSPAGWSSANRCVDSVVFELDDHRCGQKGCASASLRDVLKATARGCRTGGSKGFSPSHARCSSRPGACARRWFTACCCSTCR